MPEFSAIPLECNANKKIICALLIALPFAGINPQLSVLCSFYQLIVLKKNHPSLPFLIGSDSKKMETFGNFTKMNTERLKHV